MLAKNIEKSVAKTIEKSESKNIVEVKISNKEIECNRFTIVKTLVENIEAHYKRTIEEE